MSEAPKSKQTLELDSTTLWLVIAAFAVVSLLIAFAMQSRKAVSSTLAFAPLCDTCYIAALPSGAMPLTGGSASGTKRALLIGCNYSFAGSACLRYDCTLNGCIEDVRNLMEVLPRLGYAPANLTILVDDGSTQMPTKAVIVAALTKLITSMQAGDSSFIWFSGHGAQLANNGAEGGFNECWCPPDTIESGAYLTDDVLSSILRLAPANTSVFLGSDSCHSGTVFDLAYLAQEPGGAGGNRDLAAIRGRIPLAPKRLMIAPQALRSNAGTHEKLVATRSIERGGPDMQVVADSFYAPTAASIVALSGCQDFDTSSDAFMQGESQGAMSWAFIACLSEAGLSITLAELLRNIRGLLAEAGFTQVPQLTFGQLLNPNTATLGCVLSPATSLVPQM